MSFPVVLPWTPTQLYHRITKCAYVSDLPFTRPSCGRTLRHSFVIDAVCVFVCARDCERLQMEAVYIVCSRAGPVFGGGNLISADMPAGILECVVSWPLFAVSCATRLNDSCQSGRRWSTTSIISLACPPMPLAACDVHAQCYRQPA